MDSRVVGQFGNQDSDQGIASANSVSEAGGGRLQPLSLA
jgi:hypothetical protein